MVRETRPLTRMLLFAIGAWALVSCPFGLPVPVAGRVAAAYVLPISVAAIAWLAVRIGRKGRDRAPLALLSVGWALILGGIAADMTATVAHTPDLARERNPVARALLDSGHGVTVVYVYGIAVQGLGAIAICALWAGFLRHRRTWIATALSLKPGTFGAFVKATHAGHLRHRRFFAWPNRSERASSYHFLWFWTPPLAAATLQSWYLAFVWLGWVSDGHEMRVGFVCVALALVAMLCWLRREYRAAAGTRSAPD